MVYESSYDAGRSPYVPDLNRGSWAAPTDFIMAGIGVAFKMDVFSLSSAYLFESGVFSLIPYLLCLFVYVVPIMVIQAFMGQFSSSGFISAFRVSPLFKGIGYMALVTNLMIVCYYSLFVAMPLIYLFSSVRPTLPWSCDLIENWDLNTTDTEYVNYCNLTRGLNESLLTTTTIITTTTTTTSTTTTRAIAPRANETDDDYYDYVNVGFFEKYHFYHLPSVIYFRKFFHEETRRAFPFHHSKEFCISWVLLACLLLTWGTVAALFWKFFNTEKFGKLIRYGVAVTLGLLLICVVRFAFLPRAAETIWQFVWPSDLDTPEHWLQMLNVPVFAITSLGSGWGSFVALASFNKFNTNIQRHSWFICLGQLVIFLLMSLITRIIEGFNENTLPDNYYTMGEHHWSLVLMSGTVLDTEPWANLWCIILYTMLVLAALIVMSIQLYTVFTTVFDEFELLRNRKEHVILGTIGVLSITSFYYATNHGVSYLLAFSADSLYIQIILDLLLLLVMLWIYGRERFQRDIEFMLGERFSTWRVNILRFVAPVFLLFTMLCATIFVIEENYFSDLGLQLFTTFLGLLPFIILPAYMIFILLQTSGNLKQRFVRCTRPNDWYPMQPEDRQRYEDAMANTDLTHQLSEVLQEPADAANTQDVY